MLNYHQVTTKSTKPRHILEEIVWYKKQEVAQRIEQLSLADLKLQLSFDFSRHVEKQTRNLTPQPPTLVGLGENSKPLSLQERGLERGFPDPVKSQQLSFAALPRDFLNALRQSPTKPSIIAEVKKASPSKGVIRGDFDPVKIAQAYERGGANCISVLTDEKFFQGSFENLRVIRNSVTLPLLCKEFIIDPYQIYLARVNGADAILLIAAILSDETLQNFLQIARDLGMTVLIEVHTLEELDRVLELENVQLIGINNRNLADFSLDLGTTQRLLAERQQKLSNLDITVVSESGLYTSSDLAFVAQAGAEAVLIGESLVKQADLEQAIKQLKIKNSTPLAG